MSGLCRGWICSKNMLESQMLINMSCIMIFFVAPATRGWNRSQAAGWVVESNCAGADESFASLCNCEQLCTNRKRVWQSLPPLPPELCIKTSFAGTGAKSSPAFNPSSVSPSTRDANTRMICTAVEGGLHHKALVGQMICRSGVD